MCVRPKVTNLDKMRVRNHQKKWKPSENHTKRLNSMDFGLEITMVLAMNIVKLDLANLLK